MKKPSWVTACFRFSLLLLLFTSLAGAQVLPGSISGTVQDPTEAVIPGAKVTVLDLETGRQYNATTDQTGYFVITNLANGFYKVTVEVQGFAKFTVPRLQVLLAQTSKILARMELAKAGSEVIVSAEQVQIDTESAELKNSIDRAQILNLPLPTRNPLDLVRTMMGVVTPTSSGIADSFVHGLRGNSTNITQDGINVADNFVKTSSFFAISAPTVDSTGEFNVSIGGIGVDAGFGAAQVNIRTQRGSNDFHGSLFWFQRTNAFAANTWFNNSNGRNAAGDPVSPRPFQLQNRIGANAGGPVYIPKVYDGRNRTWVFGTYELFREPLSRSRTRTVLAPAARTGMFTWTPPGGTPQTIDLLTIGQIGTTGIVPAINSDVMTYYNALVPDPNTDSGCTGDSVNIRCFQFNLPGKNKTDKYVLRADHQLTKNHSIEFVFSQSDFDSTPDLLNGIEPNFPKSIGGGQISRRQVLSWGFQSAFGQNKTNEVRVGYQRAPVAFDLFEKYAATGGFQLDLPTVTDPTITQGNLPQGRNTPVRQVSDNFAWSKGRHTMRFGGEWRLVIANSFFFNNVVPTTSIGSNSNNTDGIGTSDFPGGITSGALTNAQSIFRIVTGLLGSVTQGFNHTSPTSGYVAGEPRTVTPIQHNMAGYFQDSWKMLPNLTLTFGTRYEYQGVFDLRNGLVLLPQDGPVGLWGPAGVNNLFNPIATPAVNDVLLDFAGSKNGKPVYQRDLNNFAPFLGFAWDPWKDGKTSIRGGGTVHFTQDGFTLFGLAGTGNTGLFSVLANSAPSGVFTTASNPTPAPPVASFPVSQEKNYNVLSQNSNLWVFDANLRTPYVIEWNLSVSRELWKRITLEARYVGNHAVKLFRSHSINELNFFNSPYTFGGNSVSNILNEFKNAQTNLTICTANRVACTGTATGTLRFNNVGLAGQFPLPILEALFNGSPSVVGTGPLVASAGFQSTAFVTNLQQNQIGAMFNTLRRSNSTYRPNREGLFPLNFFVANPWAANSILVNNSSWSYYHGFEIELRRRFSSGLFFQTNYTFGKVLTDARFLTSQNEFQNYLSITDPKRDKNRAAFDITHSISATYIYPLPFGKGKWLGRNANTFVDKLIGNWQIQGFTRLASGAPFNITSGRLTTASLEGNTAVLRNMTASQLQQQIGNYQTPQGVFWLNPSLNLYTINTTTKASTVNFCTTGQTSACFAHPGVNEFGNLPFFGVSAPWFVNHDFSIIKRTPVASISESFNFEIRFEFFNALNHPNFGGLTTAVDSSSFGKYTNTVDTVRGGGVTSRLIQWAIRVNW